VVCLDGVGGGEGLTAPVAGGCGFADCFGALPVVACVVGAWWSLLVALPVVGEAAGFAAGLGGEGSAVEAGSWEFGQRVSCGWSTRVWGVGG